MNTIFALSFARILPIVAGLTVLTLLVLLLMIRRVPYLARVALRNVPRQRGRTILVIAGLMLATMFVSAALEIDETITTAVEQVAVINLGRVDEDVLGGSGSLGVFPESYATTVAHALAHDSQVAGTAPVLAIPDVLVQDTTTSLVRGGVTAMGLSAASTGPLGTFQRGTQSLPAHALDGQGIYLNASMARLLNASPGDTVALYSAYWPGKRLSVVVRAVVSGGPLGSNPSVVLSLPLVQAQVGQAGHINHIYVANTGDGLSGVGASDGIAANIGKLHLHSLRVSEVKQNGIAFALSAEATFGRILFLFTLFALSVGLLLIFLIFALLAEERRVELATLRALGVRRGQLIWLLLFEGIIYGAGGAALGAFAGLGLSALIIALVTPTVRQLGYPLVLAVDPLGLGMAFCIGFLCTLATILLAATVLSRMTIAAALRDLPEPPRPVASARALVVEMWNGLRHLRRWPGRALDVWLRGARTLVVAGLLPLVVGVLVLRSTAPYKTDLQIAGLVLAFTGVVLLVRTALMAGATAVVTHRRAPFAAVRLRRWNAVINQTTLAVVGGAMVLYWAWPTNLLAGFGVYRFAGNIDILFIAGMMLVLGVTLIVVPNLDLALLPPTRLARGFGWLDAVARVVRAYPLAQRFRTGINLALLTLICFALVLMVCITSSLFAGQAGLTATVTGYDIIGDPLFRSPGTPEQVQQQLQRSAPATADSISAISAAQPIPVGVVQPDAPSARWSLYPAAAIQGGFLFGVGLPLLARAPGYGSDADVWQAVRDTPGAVVVDIGALSPEDAAALGAALPPPPTAAEYLGPPILSALPGVSDLFTNQEKALSADQRLGLLSAFASVAAHPKTLDLYTLRLSGLVTGPGTIAPTTLWVGDLRGGDVTPVTVVGLVADANGLRHGIFGSPATFAPLEAGKQSLGGPYYYFKLGKGQDVHQAAYSIGAALSNSGFEATPLADILVDIDGPRIFISRLLLGFLGLTLIVSLAALGVTGASGVRERRQQIGMLRALGYKRAQVALIFLAEAFLVGLLGTVLGLVLGLLLCRNAFAAGFFNQFNTQVTFVAPRLELGLICLAALLATLFAAVVPAWQASRVRPAEALRYE